MSAQRDAYAAIAVTRFGLGAKPGELAAAKDDPRGWLKAQISTSGADQPPGPLPGTAQRFSAVAAYLAEVQLLKKSGAPAIGATAVSTASPAMPSFNDARRAAAVPLLAGVRDEIFARTILGAETSAPFRERWTLFWANHFTVATSKLQSVVLAGPFEREAVRPHVFGRFEDILVASTTHPGMLIYLDQAWSTGPDSMAGQRNKTGLNENLAREVLELHTVGADAGYTQADVTEFARALTGYGIGAPLDPDDIRGRYRFRPALHEPGSRTVMGKTYPQEGEAQARAILADLAASPKTASHVARKLAIHFVADDPPGTLVARLRQSFLDSHGDLAALAETLIEAPEGWSPDARKFKTPNEFVLSAYRAAATAPSDPQKDAVQPLTALGQRPFAAPQPNGWSDLASDWAAPDALIKRLVWASRFAAAQVPGNAVPVDVAAAALGARLSAATELAISRAETRFEAFAILLMSPEFQRR